MIKDTTYNQSQFSGISNVENAPIGNGFVIAQIYNPQTTFSSDVYQYLSDSGSTITISSDDSIGKVLDIKSRNDTLFSLSEEYILKIKLFDSLGNLIGNIPLDTTTALVRFNATSFEFGPSGIIVFGHKAFNTGPFDSHYCIRYVDWQGNLIFEYLKNASSFQDEIASVSIVSNTIVFSGKQNLLTGVDSILLGKLNMNGNLLWDTALVYQTPQRGITEFKTSNEYVYYGIVGWNSSTNMYSAQIQCLNTLTNSITTILEIDSLINKVNIKFEKYNSNIIACVGVENNGTSNYKFYQLTPTNYLHFYSYIDTTHSFLSYFMIDNSDLYWGSPTFLAKYELMPLVVEGENPSPFFSVSPNPASTSLNIRLMSEILGLKYNLLTLNGTIVKASDHLPDQLNVENLPHGIYLLRVFNDYHSYFKKIIIHH